MLLNVAEPEDRPLQKTDMSRTSLILYLILPVISILLPIISQSRNGMDEMMMHACIHASSLG